MAVHEAKSRIRRMPPKTVFVVGAGFSAGLGYPLVNDLLIKLWADIPTNEKNDLKKVISFHHPGFDPGKNTSYPNIETLLSEMEVNQQLFEASRKAPTGFTLPKLKHIRDDLLYSISKWFHQIYEKSNEPEWLADFKERVFETNATIISFNWDLVIDHLIFGNNISAENYGLGSTVSSSPLLIKPHGSLNWYDEEQGEKIKKVKRIELYSSEKGKVFAFTEFREPKGKQRYTPLIIPPVFNKRFEQEVFTPLWQKCVSEISTARHVVFLGYSLPDADLHARFILRCGFHNQVEGVPTAKGRATPTGESGVTIVNPDVAAARRIEGVTSRNIKCDWQPLIAEKWILRK